VSRFPFLVVRGRAVMRSCQADDLHHAISILNPDPTRGEWCVSDASWKLGLPAPLAKTRCGGCGIREAERGSDRCHICRNRQRREWAETHRDQSGKGLKVPRPTRRRFATDHRGRPRTDEEREAISRGMKATLAKRKEAQ
jgi:hypothetical protein